MSKVKISKLMIWPTRTIGLGNYNSVKLSVGVEIAFEKPVSMNSKRVENALNDARKLVRREFIKQYEPYRNKGGEK